MRKNELLISILLGLMLLTAACSQGIDNSLNESSAPTSIGETSSAALLTESVETAATEAPANTFVTETDSTAPALTVPSPTPTPSVTLTPEENLSDLLDQITNMEEGTAGASIKRAALSGSILDWVESSSLSSEDSKMQVDAYLQDLGDASYVDLFIMNFESVSTTVQLIIDKDDSTLGMLFDSGYTLKHSSYTQVIWDEFAADVQSTADEY